MLIQLDILIANWVLDPYLQFRSTVPKWFVECFK